MNIDHMSPFAEMMMKMLEMMIICKVEEKKGEESKVELKRDSGGLGLSIVGGSDTPLVRKILIQIHPSDEEKTMANKDRTMILP